MQRDINRLACLLGAGILTLAPLAGAEDTSSITVYSDGFGLVTETREMAFEKGTQSVLFDGVSQYIEASSVLFHAKGLSLLEQNYEYDLVDGMALARRYLGEMVDVRSGDEELIRGRLLSADYELVLDTGDGILNLRADAVRSIQYPTLPEGLRIKPALRWLVNAPRSGSQEVSISYITGGLGWNAEYVCLVNEDDSAMELASWVNLNNNTGISWQNATLQLVAGEVNRVRNERMSKSAGRGIEYMAMADANEGFEEESFFEYHLYTLGRPVDLANRQDKQVSLFPPVDVSLTKHYTWSSNRGHEGVQVTLEFVNSEGKGPGQPLPAGRFRLYKKDSAGRRQLIGEDAIEHTPVDEEVDLTIGQAFDLVVERTTMDEKRSGRTYEYAAEFKVRNRKKEAVTIDLQENVWGDWEVLSCSQEYSKKDARTLLIPVQVPAGEERTVTLRARTH